MKQEKMESMEKESMPMHKKEGKRGEMSEMKKKVIGTIAKRMKSQGI